MDCLEFSDATSFLDRTREHLLSHEDLNNMLMSSAWTLAKNSTTRSGRLQFFAIENERKIKAAALNASDRKLLLSSCDPAASEFLGRDLRDRAVAVGGLFGPEKETHSLAGAYGVAKFRSNRLMNGMRLDRLEVHPTAQGLMRAAKISDLDLVTKWCRAFIKECDLDDSPDESEDLARKFIEGKRLFLWEDREVVAMTGYGGFTPRGVRVSMVYTPKAARGRGFARSLVQGVSRRLLQSGDYSFSFLFADAANEMSNRIYEKIGYRTIAKFAEYRNLK